MALKSLLLIAVGLVVAIEESSCNLFCYYGSWSNERSGIGGFDISDLPTDLCTHIIYSFVNLTTTGEIALPTQQTINDKSNSIEEFVKLKESNSSLKLMVAVGGWSAGSANFSTVVNNETLRANFVENTVKFLDTYGLDGFDLDWEYPAQRDGSTSTDKDAFVKLTKELRAAFDSKSYILTAAVAVTQSNIDLSYDVTDLATYLDYFNLMLYDFHGSWDSVTGVNAPLYAQLTDDSTTNLNVNYSVNTWINNGAPASQLVLGMGLYAKTFTLTSLNDTDTGAACTGAGVAGPYLNEAGSYAYYELYEDQQNNTDSWNITQVDTSYVYGNKDLFWAGYDNVNTIKAKAQYAKEMGLGGIMVWAVDLDDFSGISGTKYPLITAALQGYN